MSRDAFLELRNMIQRELSAHPETSGGEINCIDIDLDTGELLVTSQFTGGQRTHRIIIKDETPAKPPGEAWAEGDVSSTEYFKKARDGAV